MLDEDDINELNKFAALSEKELIISLKNEFGNVAEFEAFLEEIKVEEIMDSELEAVIRDITTHLRHKEQYPKIP